MKMFAWIALVSFAAPALAAGNGNYAAVNGLQMYYEIHGKATAGRPTLVLLHGGSATIDSSFSRLLPLLAATRRVIAAEQQGHGHTADIDRPLSYAQMADDTAALLAVLHEARVDCLGFSDGGNVALQLAIRHPERVRRIVASGASFRLDGLQPDSLAFIRAATPASWPPPVRAAYLRVAPDPKHWEPFILKIKQLWLETPDWPAEQLQSIHTPVLLVLGDRDDVRLEHGVLMKKLIPDSQLAVLPGTSHFTVFEQPELLSRMASTFLDAPAAAQK